MEIIVKVRAHAVILLTILLLCNFQKEPILTEKWDTLKEFPNDWTSLERDEKGYLVYAPCDGGTPKVLIIKDTLTFIWQLETKKYFVKKFSKINDNHYVIKCYGTIYGKEFLADEPDVFVNVKVVDRKKKLVLWKWITDYGAQINIRDSTKWVMTPSKFSNEFRQVSNPCLTEKKGEKDFLPIEFN